jgi:hypothetical protein
MTSHVDEKPTTPLVGRRAVARGAAWSLPVVALAVAAPANAATSVCHATTGKLAWTSQPSGNLLGQILTTTVADVTVRVTATGDTSAPNNGIRSSGPIGGANSLLLLHSQNDKNNTTQTVTVKFSKPVQNVSFTFLDIDSSQTVTGKGKHETITNHWQDKVSILPAPSAQTKGSTVQGSGTTAAPWRAVTQDTVVADGGTTGNVTVSWSTTLDTITFVYSQDGTQDGSPKVGLSDISFQTVC